MRTSPKERGMGKHFIATGFYEISWSGIMLVWICVPGSHNYFFIGFESQWVIPWPKGKFKRLRYLTLTLEMHVESSDREGHFRREISQLMSAKWWNHRHFQHHIKPNTYPKDPDVDVGPLFLVGDSQPVKVGLEFLNMWEIFLEVVPGNTYGLAQEKSRWGFPFQARSQSMSPFNFRT